MSTGLRPEPAAGKLHPRGRIGIRLFNDGKYYPAPDHLELAWRDSPGEEGLLYKAILQIGIAYYQIQQGNTRGALNMFQRGHRHLDTLPDCVLGINVRQLGADARQVEKALRKLGPEQLPELDQALFRTVSRVQDKQC